MTFYVNTKAMITLPYNEILKIEADSESDAIAAAAKEFDKRYNNNEDLPESSCRVVSARIVGNGRDTWTFIRDHKNIDN